MNNRFIRARRFLPALSFVAVAAQQSVLAYELNPVVVSASRVEQPLADVLSSASVISREEIERSQAASLADLLQGEAGIEFGRNGGPGATTSFFLRGQNSTNLVILVDGVRSQVDAYGNLQLTDIPLEQVERVEVLRGNASALYGDAAIGGVINIFTRKGKKSGGSYGQVSFGSLNSTKIFAGYNGETETLRYDFNLGQNRSDGLSAMDSGINTRVNPDKDGYRSRYLSGRLENRLSPDVTLGVRFSASESWVNSDSGNQSDPSYGIIGDVSTDLQKLRRHRDVGAIFMRYSFVSQWVGSVDVSRATLKFEDYKNGIRIGSGVGEYYENGLIEGSQNTVQWDNVYRVNPATNVQFGATIGTEKFNASGNSPYTLSRENTGIYTGLTHALERWTFQFNIRKDSANLTYQGGSNGQSTPTAVTGLAGLAYRISPHWRLTATTSTGFKIPGAAEVASNSALRPESHKSNELGVTYSDESSLLRAVYFDTQTQDAIVYANTAPYALSNIGAVRNNGVEMTARGRIYSLNWKGTLVVQDPWNVTDNIQLARRAQEYGQIDISWMVNRYDLGARIYTSGSRTDGATANTLAGYGLLSIYASKQLTDQWIARVRIDNVQNKAYQLAYGFNTPGRTLMATLQYSPK
jgi:vitamin B12 transporter